MLKVAEMRRTLCGETPLAGVPCSLIRLFGCDLRCRWCDSVHARGDGDGQPRELELEQLVQWAGQGNLELVLLTGGEPLLQAELSGLASRLVERGHKVLVETSGAYDIRALAAPVIRCVDIKCPGSGESHRNLWRNLQHLRPGDSVKMILTDRDDYRYAKDVITRQKLGHPVNILLSCAYPNLEPEVLAGWMIDDGLSARLNVQLHKLLWPRLG